VIDPPKLKQLKLSARKESVVAAKPAGIKDENADCPECGVAKHTLGCAFLAWKKDQDKTDKIIRG